MGRDSVVSPEGKEEEKSPRTRLPSWCGRLRWSSPSPRWLASSRSSTRSLERAAGGAAAGVRPTFLPALRCRRLLECVQDGRVGAPTGEASLLGTGWCCGSTFCLLLFASVTGWGSAEADPRDRERAVHRERQRCCSRLTLALARDHVSEGAVHSRRCLFGL